jgi:hypothetical protein
MAMHRYLNTGLFAVDDVREDGQAGVGIGRAGVTVVVLPGKGTFSASTEISPEYARELARELNELADRFEAREGVL